MTGPRLDLRPHPCDGCDDRHAPVSQVTDHVWFCKACLRKYGLVKS